MKAERLEARVTPAQKRIIARAAELRGTTLTDFVVTSAEQAATEAIRASETLVLQAKASEAFVNALLNPPAPNAAARAAVRRYKERLAQ